MVIFHIYYLFVLFRKIKFHLDEAGKNKITIRLARNLKVAITNNKKRMWKNKRKSIFRLDISRTPLTKNVHQ